MDMDIENAMKGRVIRALNKVVWIQNDLFVDAYLEDGKESATGTEKAVTPPPDHGEKVGGGSCPFAH